MASGILGGGSLTQDLNVNPYTTPTGKVTTATLVLSNAAGSGSGSCGIKFGPFSFVVSVPDGGRYTISGVILGSGQAVRLKSYVTTLSYMLTGWESTE